MRLPWRVATFGPAIETSLTPAEAMELQRLAALRRVLEIGAAFGYSTVVLAEVALHVTSVDPHEVHASVQAFAENLRLYGVSWKVHPYFGTSEEKLPILPTASFDLAFVDGDHRAAGVAFDLQQVQRLVVPGGVLAFHDWDEESCPDVRQVLEAWRRPDYLIDTLAVYQL